MRCYQVDCPDDAVAYCIVDEKVACETHAVWDYFRYFENPILVPEESCPCFMGGSCPTDYEHEGDKK